METKCNVENSFKIVEIRDQILDQILNSCSPGSRFDVEDVRNFISVPTQLTLKKDLDGITY
jgi:hypothetical protein